MNVRHRLATLAPKCNPDVHGTAMDGEMVLLNLCRSLLHCLLVYDPDVARREFVALTQLVRQADCYLLHFGRDVLDLPWLITPLLQAREVRMRH